MKYDVLIIGGGAAGLTCGLTLASVRDKFNWSKERNYLIIDDNNSDLCKARLFNAPGVEYGIHGCKAVELMKAQIQNFDNIEIVDDTVIKAHEANDNFTVTTKSGQTYQAAIVVIATGMHQFDIKGLHVDVCEHNRVLKPNKIKLKNDNLKIRENLYVAGLAAGSKTMFAIAAGDGAQAACDIFEAWTGKFAVAHDAP